MEDDIIDEEQTIEDNVDDIINEEQNVINNFALYIHIMEDYLTNQLIKVLGYEIDIDDFIHECLPYGDTFAVMRYDREQSRLRNISCYDANYSLMHLLWGERQRKLMGHEYAYNLNRHTLRVCKRTVYPN